jgi:hypothetical protein
MDKKPRNVCDQHRQRLKTAKLIQKAASFTQFELGSLGGFESILSCLNKYWPFFTQLDFNLSRILYFVKVNWFS